MKSRTKSENNHKTRANVNSRHCSKSKDASDNIRELVINTLFSLVFGDSAVFMWSGNVLVDKIYFHHIRSIRYIVRYGFCCVHLLYLPYQECVWSKSFSSKSTSTESTEMILTKILGEREKHLALQCRT